MNHVAGVVLGTDPIVPDNVEADEDAEDQQTQSPADEFHPHLHALVPSGHRSSYRENRFPSQCGKSQSPRLWY
jgi:hypothetical protein